MERHKLAVLFALETKTVLDSVLPGKGRTIITRGAATDNSGVAVMWPEGKHWKIINSLPRVIRLHHRANITVIGAYGPNEQSKEKDRRAFWKSLEDCIADIALSQVVVIIGDLNAGNEESKHPAVFGEVTNFTLLAEFATKFQFEIQDHGPTWVSPASAAAASSTEKDTPNRTLDRCLVRYPGFFSSAITTDFTLRPADHAILCANLHFLDIPRDSNRPTHQKEISAVDKKWMDAKAGIQFFVNVAIPLNTVNEFWRAKHLMELEERLSLQILDDKGAELSTEDGAAHIREYLFGVWGSGQGSWSDLISTHGLISPSPTEKEVQSAIGRLKSDTALGKDRISPRAVKANVTSAKIYKDLFGYIWPNEEIPHVWKATKVKPIPKGASPAKVTGCRPISCTSVSSKVMNGIIIKRCTDLYESRLHDSQHAYRKERSCSTAINELITCVKANNGVREVAFIDIRKAYDTVSKEGMKAALDRWDLPRTERNLIVQQYMDSEVYVELSGCVATPFVIQRGLRQGCALSCLLFGLIMAETHYQLEKIMGKSDFGMISYSDDVVLHAKDLKLLRRIVKILNGVLMQFGLSINNDKTSFFQFNLSSISEDTTTWLGFELSASLSWNAYFNSRLDKIRTSAELMSRVLASKKMFLQGKNAILVIQGLMGCYVQHPPFIELSDDHQRCIENELARIVAKFSKFNIKKSTTYAVKMMKAIELEESQVPLLSCEFCHKEFRNDAGLRSHLSFCKANITKAAPAMQPCPHCSKMFHNRGIKRHVQACDPSYLQPKR